MSVETVCPDCETELTLSLTGGAPWCPKCDWGLDRPFECEVTGVGWLDRLLFRAAYRRDRRQFQKYAGREVTRPGFGVPGAILVVVSAGLLLATLGSLALAGWLVLTRLSVPNALAALGLVVLAWLLAPRYPDLTTEFERVDPATAPTLFALVERIAAAAGVPAPDHLGIGRHFTASAWFSGFSRRRGLYLGLVMWAALPAQQRVAVIGHEMGHLIRGDARSSVLTLPALTTFRNLSVLAAPWPRRPGGLLRLVVVDLLVRPVRILVSRVLLGIHVCLWLQGVRRALLAEYHSDDLAVRIAGSAATRDFLDSLAGVGDLDEAVRRAARDSVDPQDWRAAADEAREQIGPALPWLRQFSIRTGTSILADHPPTGLRARAIEARPWREPVVVLTQEESDRIDAELADFYRRYAPDIGAPPP
ncbi:M48 family metalloprotease [Longispora sp. K20-0274]|uniref:M48 family metalloprotease n=1 Tax=Longispora sp. K20-0274 TaxID=3088255 RepID=UPI00399AC772